ARVDVKVAEQKRFVSRHQALSRGFRPSNSPTGSLAGPHAPLRSPGSLAAARCLIEGLSPLELPYWLARGDPTPRSARQAHSLPLVRPLRATRARLRAPDRRAGAAESRTRSCGRR